MLVFCCCLWILTLSKLNLVCKICQFLSFSIHLLSCKGPFLDERSIRMRESPIISFFKKHFILSLVIWSLSLCFNALINYMSETKACFLWSIWWGLQQEASSRSCRQTTGSLQIPSESLGSFKWKSQALESDKNLVVAGPRKLSQAFFRVSLWFTAL